MHSVDTLLLGIQLSARTITHYEALYTRKCTITITNRSIRRFSGSIRFRKREPKLLVSAVDIAEGYG
jgi:hypothetical protein